MSKGKLYGVGVGPGDPELMTLKAVRLLEENSVIALPGPVPQETVAYRIAAAAVPTLADKTLIAAPMPMTMDADVRREGHEQSTKQIASYLSQGKNVVFLTLGDVTIYSTFFYVKKRIEDMGYETELVSGIPSFCAAAARLGISLCEWNEPLKIYPARHTLKAEDVSKGNVVLMKAASRMGEVKELLSASGRQVVMVENCGMDTEQIYRSAEEIPENAGYFSLIVVKDRK